MAVVSVVKKCMHCGCENELDVAELGEVLGYPDLDSRPSVLDNQMINFGIQRCKNCQYASSDIEVKMDFDESILESDEYVDIVNSNYPYVARSYMLASMIMESKGEYQDAAKYMLKACWVLDDHEQDAADERIKAANLFAQDELKDENKYIVIDLYRRAEYFEDAKDLLDSVELDIVPDELYKFYDFERILIDACDSECHNVSEYNSFKGGSKPSETPLYDSMEELERKLFDQNNQETIRLPFVDGIKDFNNLGTIQLDVDGINKYYSLLSIVGGEDNVAYVYELTFNENGKLIDISIVNDENIVNNVFEEYNKLVEQN